MITSDEERQAPAKVEETEPSHLIRYKFALDYISPNEKVLDAPCGSGYGTKLLTQNGAEVYGVDIHIYVGDIENLKEIFPDEKYFDVIVSFEGIEHLRHPKLFLNEVKRLLKSGGKFIISTPRKPHGSPYHITEYSLEEFENLLSQKFIIKQMFGQIYTDIFDLSKRKENHFAYKRFNFIAYCLQK
jgi:2-polyprenyl-3-methyl-5-hydroxy-6-metoxy-1,4-benzoquinol methylase